MIVTLTVAEMALAAQVGVMRRTRGLTGTPRYGYDDDAPWENDIVAAQAELALSRQYNLHWSGVVPYARDAGDIIDARSIRQPHHRLTIHDADPDEVPFVLVWRIDRFKMDFKLCGWVFAREGKLPRLKQKVKDGGDPAYYVDKELLHPMTRLEPWIDAHRKPLKT